jgi:O-palmitoleoyl-L-serine hydrolase
VISEVTPIPLSRIFQLQQSVAPRTADPQGQWRGCRMNHASCNSNQLQVLHGIFHCCSRLLSFTFFFVKTRSIHLVCFDSGFRSQMLNAVSGFSASRQNGVFINSCFAHCQSERQDTWYANSSPRLGNKVLRCAATNHLLLIPL